MFRIVCVIHSATIVDDTEQLNDAGIRFIFYRQSQTILSDPAPVRYAVDTLPIKLVVGPNSVDEFCLYAHLWYASLGNRLSSA